MPYKKTTSLFLADYPRTLFPLETNRILIENAAPAIGAFVYEGITAGKGTENFLPQFRVYAAKPGYHLRRTVKLDPIAEFYLYDVVYRHRTALGDKSLANRRIYGYCFSKGEVASPTASYQSFQKDDRDLQEQFAFRLRFDIASYFNSIYHHDLVHWFTHIANTDDDVSLFGKFFRQINSGRTIDCLPHGVLPAKIIGNHFLHFLNESHRVRSEVLLRFMDDIVLLSDSDNVLVADFEQAQRLLGEKGLSVNASKTRFAKIDQLDIGEEIDGIKLSLLKRRKRIVLGLGYEDDNDQDDDEKEGLTENEVAYLIDLLKREHLAEEDGELILTLMRDHAESVLEHIPTLLRRFPNLSKNVCYFCEAIEDRNNLSKLILDFLKAEKNLSEYQLFWLGCLTERHLSATADYPEVLFSLYEHGNATVISRAKILEIPEKRYGLPDLREEHLKTGASDWLSWSAAVGARREKRASRNHLLGYFSNASPMNHLIADCVKKL